MVPDELLNSHGRLTRHVFDRAVGAGEHTVLIVGRNGTQVNLAPPFTRR